MNPTNRNDATSAATATPDQLAGLHDAARLEAIRLRRQAIDNFWREAGRQLSRLAATASHRGQDEMINAR
jgi:hypothetical protein